MIPEGFDLEVDGVDMATLKGMIDNGGNIKYFRGVAQRLVMALGDAVLRIVPENPLASDIDKLLVSIIREGLGIHYHSGVIHRAVCSYLQTTHGVNMLRPEDLTTDISLEAPEWAEVKNG